MQEGKNKNHKKLKIIILIVMVIFFISGIIYSCYHLYNNYKEKKDHTNILDNIEVDNTQVTETKTERMLQLEEMQQENSDIVGWIEIDGTNINYPILQTTDNDYYLNHNYKKEKASTGSLFLDKDFDLVNGSSNYLIYGHRNKQGLMFEDLMKYTDEEFYKEHTKIRFTTATEDTEYEIISVFKSRVYYKDEKNVFRYYYFVNAETEEEYKNYVSSAKEVSIYDTGVTAEYGEQLLTLSTCEYSQEDGRFVVVAKR